MGVDNEYPTHFFKYDEPLITCILIDTYFGTLMQLLL